MKIASQGQDLREFADAQILWTAQWHQASSSPSADTTLRTLVEREHRANFDLWHEEDKARDPSATDSEIAAVKRAIDTLNQQRNDLVEAIDDWLLHHLPASPASASLHSETPGMMLDRLSILALKLFHTREEAERRDASEEHRSRNADRLLILQEQRSDLVNALHALVEAITAGQKAFKLYRQMKMYNDPELNPRVYGKRRG